MIDWLLVLQLKSEMSYFDQVFNTIYNGDDNVYVGAPTGSGNDAIIDVYSCN